jgi:hypothetical protein
LRDRLSARVPLTPQATLLGHLWRWFTNRAVTV